MAYSLSQIKGDFVFTPIQVELISTLEKNYAMTRTDLVKNLEKPRTTIYDNLVSLINMNIVKKYSRPTRSRGRPLVFFKIAD